MNGRVCLSKIAQENSLIMKSVDGQNHLSGFCAEILSQNIHYH